MKYRSRLDIIAMILDSIGRGAKKTVIMYHAYLSYKQMTEYLAFLVERGLITHETKTGLYKLTSNGRQAMVFIAEIEKLIGPAGPRLEDVEEDIQIPLGPKVLG